MLKAIENRSVEQIDQTLGGYPLTLQRILAARGIEHVDQLKTTLDSLPDAFLLKNMSAATDALEQVLRQQQSVVIVGDFDADGATSTSVLLLILSALGLEHINYIVPNRFDFGYGLSPEIVEVIAANETPDWIITVDNGISSIAGVKRARELGINVMVTDHHLPGESLPNANIILNPNQQGDEFPSKALAGVGVAFFLMIALRQRLRQNNYFSEHNIPEINLAQYLDLVAVGTVADVVPLDEVNRILVQQGIQRIRHHQCRPGIAALVKVARREASQLVAADLGFAVGPRLNAAGRLEDMSVGIECLVTDSSYQADSYAAELDSLNQFRREIESEMLEQALQTLDEQIAGADGYCLYDPTWHQGVVGLVASRVKEKVNRPVFAFAKTEQGELKGSGRSVAGLHLRDLLVAIDSQYPHLMSKYGGHAMAAGLSMPESSLTEFDSAFKQELERWTKSQAFDDTLLTDGQLNTQELSLEFAHQVKFMLPWGQAFPEPLFDGQFEVIQQRIVGAKHLKLLVRQANQQPIDAIAFFADPQLLEAELNRVELVYSLDVNVYRGQESLQLMVKQLQMID